MQIIQSKSNLFEKILRDKEGRLVRATFYIYESAGRVKARLVDFVYLTEEIIKSTKIFLSGFSKSNTQGNPVYNLKSLISTFLREILYFSGSKPRAPTIL